MSQASNTTPPRSSLRDMARQMSRDKADTLLLLGAALMVLAPHAAHLPAWVSALCAGCLLWRGLITFRGLRMPSSLVLLPLSLLAMGGVFFSFKTLLGRDAGVAMLVLLVAFKMLEMRARRDLFVVIFLCIFLVLTNFFYSQTIPTGIMMILSIIALLTAQLSFQFTGVVPPLGRRLAMGARILGLAAPLAVLLFVLFPRIEGPLWGMPGDAGGGRSGLSDNMAPGNLSSLAMSEETAFTVRFTGPPPKQADLYWRGVVFGNFDGRTWSQVRAARRGPPENISIELKSVPVPHQVTLEPHGKRWLFALDIVSKLPRIDDQPSTTSAELELSAPESVNRRVRYEVVSHTDYTLQAGDTLDNRERWLTLPAGYNPRAMQLGLELQRQPDPLARANTILKTFAGNGFSYTLEPPRLGRDTVDEFLYQTRAGFCEHYASAFVFLMRAADVPARVVTGYQGGDVNPIDGVMTVRQANAHAWAEIWVSGRGWLRVDPTAAVAPERIERSSGLAKPKRSPFGLDALGQLINIDIDANSWLGQLRFRMSAINNGWNQWVLNYTPERQRGFVDQLQDSLAHWPAALALAALLALGWFARQFKLRGEKDPVDALYSALCQRMGQLGMARARDEGPTAYAQRLAQLDLAPQKQTAVAHFLKLYSAHKYGPQPTAPALAATLKSLLNTI